jgi:hypothetical protein
LCIAKGVDNDLIVSADSYSHLGPSCQDESPQILPHDCGGRNCVTPELAEDTSTQDTASLDSDSLPPTHQSSLVTKLSIVSNTHCGGITLDSSSTRNQPGVAFDVSFYHVLICQVILVSSSQSGRIVFLGTASSSTQAEQHGLEHIGQPQMTQLDQWTCLDFHEHEIELSHRHRCSPKSFL